MRTHQNLRLHPVKIRLLAQTAGMREGLPENCLTKTNNNQSQDGQPNPFPNGTAFCIHVLFNLALAAFLSTGM
jgi:hypothetical protein